MPASIRRATRSDLSALIDLEAECFPASRRESPASINRSISSVHQEIWVADLGTRRVIGYLNLRIFKRTVRLYSLAVAEHGRGAGLGGRFLKLAQERGISRGCDRLSLEVESRDTRLVSWYERNSFRKVRVLPNYYGKRIDGFRMIRSLPKNHSNQP